MNKERERLMFQISAIKSNEDRDPGDITALAASMNDPNVGQLEPIVLDTKGNLIYGRRRLAAAKKNGWKKIWVEFTDKEQGALDQMKIAENIHRKNYTPTEISQRIVFDCKELFGLEFSRDGRQYLEKNQIDKLALKYNLTEDNLVQMINLSLVDPSLQKLVHEGKLTITAALLLIGYSGKEAQKLAKELQGIKGVVGVDDIYQNHLDGNHVTNLWPGEQLRAECEDCPFRGMKEPGLFDERTIDENKHNNNQCFRKDCFEKLAEETRKEVEHLAKETGTKPKEPAQRWDIKQGGYIRRDEAKLIVLEKCKGCSDCKVWSFGQGQGLSLVCPVNCSNWKRDEKAKSKGKKGAAAEIGIPDQSTVPRSEEQLMDTKMMLMARKLVEAEWQARIMAYTRDTKMHPYGPFKDENHLLAYMMTQGNPPDEVRNQEGYSSDRTLTEDLLRNVAKTGNMNAMVDAMADMILGKPPEESPKDYVTKLFQKATNFSGVRWTVIDYYWEICTGETEFLKNHEHELVKNLSQKQQDRYIALRAQNWLPPYLQPIEEEEAPEDDDNENGNDEED